MKLQPSTLPRWFAVAAFVAAGCAVSAQRRFDDDIEPRPYVIRWRGASVGVFAESTYEESGYQDGVSAKYDRIIAGPTASLDLDGFFYHPNLFEWYSSGDVMFGWSEEHTTTSRGRSFDRSGFEVFGNGVANANLLVNKPYRSTLFNTFSHTFRDYDFFNRVEVDSRRHGFTTGYSEGPVPVVLSVARYDETSHGLGFESTLGQTTVNLEARNDREFGNSVFTYGFNDYTRDINSIQTSGQEHMFGLSDREVFGSRRQIEWRNTVGYATRELVDTPRDTTPNDSLTASSILNVHHRPNLNSYYDAHYLRDEGRSTVTENKDAGAGVQHRLFSSLTSGLRVQALQYSSEREGGEFESTQYTGTWSEQYTKKLGKSARLSVGGSIGLVHTDQESSSTFQVLGEEHTFSAGGPVIDSFLLNLRDVDESTIEVFNQARSLRYTRDVDYAVLRAGERTVIRLIQPNPSGLTRDSIVVVNYQAAPQGSGTIDGIYTSAEVRLDLFNGMFGVYGRYSAADNTSSDGIIVEDYTTYTAGADYTRKWFRAGIEYQIHDSTFTDYSSLRMYQTFSFIPAEAASLSVTFSEGFTEYRSANRDEQFYSAIARYHHRITSHLGFDVEGGVSRRTGTVVDQFLAAVRPGMLYEYGNLSVKLAYSFEYHEYESTEERTRHMLTFRARRSF